MRGRAGRRRPGGNRACRLSALRQRTRGGCFEFRGLLFIRFGKRARRERAVQRAGFLEDRPSAGVRARLIRAVTGKLPAVPGTGAPRGGVYGWTGPGLLRRVLLLQQPNAGERRARVGVVRVERGTLAVLAFGILELANRFMPKRERLVRGGGFRRQCDRRLERVACLDDAAHLAVEKAELLVHARCGLHAARPEQAIEGLLAVAEALQRPAPCELHAREVREELVGSLEVGESGAAAALAHRHFREIQIRSRVAGRFARGV